MNKTKMIRIHESTKEILDDISIKTQTYDDIIKNLIYEVQNRNKHIKKRGEKHVNNKHNIQHKD